MPDTLERFAQPLGRFDGDRTDQNRLPGAGTLLDFLDNRLEFGFFGGEDQVFVVGADHRAVRRDRRHVEVVDFLEFFRFGQRRTGHARELVVHAEEVLEGDGRQRQVFAPNLHAFLRFNRLMQTFREAPTVHQASGELIDDDDFAFLNDVVFVEMIERVGAQRVVEVGDHLGVVGVIKLVDAQRALDLFDAFVGQEGDAILEVDDVVAIRLFVIDALRAAFLERAHDLRELLVQVGRLVRLTGDDQRGTRFVDQDVVHFVDDGVEQARAAPSWLLSTTMLSRR